MDDRYRVNNIDVLAVHTEIDLRVAIEEVKHAIDRIASDVRTGFGDSDWAASANFALKDLEHKGRLLQMKLESRIEAKKAAVEKGEKRHTEEAEQAFRFRSAAKMILGQETLERIKSASQLLR